MKTLKPIPGFKRYGITQCARLVNLKTKLTTIESCSGSILVQVVSSTTLMTLATPPTIRRSKKDLQCPLCKL